MQPDMLYEMLTGRRAFAGDEIPDVLAAVLTRDPDWTLLPVGLRPGVGTAPAAPVTSRFESANAYAAPSFAGTPRRHLHAGDGSRRREAGSVLSGEPNKESAELSPDLRS
jgi:hypothetical protein